MERRFTKDELLTTVMIYWITRTIATSFRFYYEWELNTLDAPKGTSSRPLDPGERIAVPSAFAMFQGGPSRAEAERTYNLQRYTIMPRGGHFAAMEEPELLVEDIRAFFRALRSGITKA